MHRVALQICLCLIPGMRRGRALVSWCRGILLATAVLGMMATSQAGEPELTSFDVASNDEGVLLTYTVNIDLSRSVDDALSKAVPLYFVAEAEVFRNRWYWRDQRVAHAVRVWKIVFQPLTSAYRVTFGGLSQNFSSREEALTSISRGARWKIAEPGQLSAGNSHYLEFTYRLDTSLLPRPMQIGLGGQSEWALSVQRTQRIN